MCDEPREALPAREAWSRDAAGCLLAVHKSHCCTIWVVLGAPWETRPSGRVSQGLRDQPRALGGKVDPSCIGAAQTHMRASAGPRTLTHSAQS